MLKDKPSSRDLTRTTLAVLFIAVLIAACFWVLKPFLPALVWAGMIVVATWPLMLSVQRYLWGSRILAVGVMTAVLLMLLVVPLWLAIGTIVENAEKIGNFSRFLLHFNMPPPPDWVAALPLVGGKLAAAWQQVADAHPEALLARMSPYIRKFIRWFIAEIGGLGMVLIQFLLTLGISAILYSNGETAAAGMRRFARRLAGERGENAAFLAAQAIRAVSLGVVVTALVQALLAGVGLALSGVPYAATLTAVIFILGVAQLGPMPVLVPAVIWLYWKNGPLWGTLLLVWSIPVGALDNFLRPILIRRGADLPLLLIFAGVIGGLIAFGIIGLFIGPVVLAVSYTLLTAWVAESPATTGTAPQPNPDERG